MLVFRRARQRVVVLAFFLVIITPLLTPSVKANPFSSPQDIARSLSGTPSVAFVPNRGQQAGDIRYRVDVGGGTFDLLDNGFKLNVENGRPPTTEPVPQHKSHLGSASAIVDMRFLGAATNPHIEAHSMLPSLFHDFTGDDPSRWQTNLPTYAGVRYTGLYPNIIIDYAGDRGELKSTYTVVPGGNPEHIRWRYSGVQDIRIAPSGELVLTLPPINGQFGRTVTETAPIAWQEVGIGQVDVGVRFTLNRNREVGFAVDNYNASLPLVIDPTFSTTVVDLATTSSVAVDTQGNVYITGYSTNGGRLHKLNATGSLLATYAFGASGPVDGNDVAVASDGRIAIAGTDSASQSGTISRSFVATWSATGAYALVPFASNVSTTAHSVAFHPTTQALYALWVLGGTPGAGTIAQISNGSVVNTRSVSPYTHDMVIAADGTFYTTYTVSNGYGNSDGFLIKKTAGGTETSLPMLGWGSLAVDGSNNVYAASFHTIQDTGAPQGTKLEVRSWNTSGNVRYTYQRIITDASSNSYTLPKGITVRANGTAVVVGSTDASSFPIINGSSGVQAGRYAGFIIEIAPDGSTIAASEIYYHQTSGTTHFSDITKGLDGSLFIAGYHVNTYGIGFLGLRPGDGGTTPVTPVPTPTAILPTASPTPVPAPSPPAFTYSVYIQSLDPSIMTRLGRLQRCKAPGVVFLAFGAPIKVAGQSGATIFGGNDATLPEIATAVEHYVSGYWNVTTCQQGSLSARNLTIAVGTSNSPLGEETGPDNEFVTYEHGADWGRMINDLNQALSDNGYRSSVKAVGGYDAEAGWTSFTPTYSWVSGYWSTARYSYYFYGSCDGCPTTQPRSQWNTGDLDKILLLTSSGSSKLFPQIYYARQAQQWYNVTRYSREAGVNVNVPMYGVMTDCRATAPLEPTDPTGCRFNDSRLWTEIPSTGRNDFPPNQGWQAMYDTFHAATAPDGSTNTIQSINIPYLTDIGYSNEY